MSQSHDYTLQVRWERNGAVFTDRRYSRVHEWLFDGGLPVRASSSPLIVPVPLSDTTAVDPEEAFLASLSSCHMLWFLDFASRRGLVVDRYEDRPAGVLQRDAAGKLAITTVILRPRVEFAGDAPPDKAAIAALHEAAHEHCFLANSVKTAISIEPPSP
jgi:organic hydroperoxide reductase OsmC/OhrA